MKTMNSFEVDPEMDAILSIDTTKRNRIINQKGFAISPTVKDGYILRVSEDLLDIMQIVTGRLPVVFAITTQDITPYGNGIYHLNSIMQPSTSTNAPVIGVAITTEVPVPGCATGASHAVDIEMAVRFCVEVAKALEVFLNRKITGLFLYHYRLSLLCIFHQGIPEEGLDTVLIVQ